MVEVGVLAALSGEGEEKDSRCDGVELVKLPATRDPAAWLFWT